MTLAQLERMGPAYAVEFGKQLIEAFGPLAASPSARLRYLANRQREIEEELRQLADHIERVS